MAEIGEVCEVALAVKELATELSFQLLDRPRERGLRDVAPFSSAREVQLLCDREKITDLMHLHGSTPQQRSTSTPCEDT